MILLTYNSQECIEEYGEPCSDWCAGYDAGAKAQAKKILIKLQAIYNLPDEGMFHKKMGEFIQELMEEVQ